MGFSFNCGVGWTNFRFVLGGCRQQSKLTASRQLRIRKIALHVRIFRRLSWEIYSDLALFLSIPQVYDKLERMTNNGSRAPSIRSSVDGNGSSTHSRSNSGPTTRASNNSPVPQNPIKHEEEYEILCNETLLPLSMTLAAVRQYVWKQSSELIMHYRRRVNVSSGAAGRLSR